jgi:hypothetical protein
MTVLGVARLRASVAGLRRVRLVSTSFGSMRLSVALCGVSPGPRSNARLAAGTSSRSPRTRSAMCSPGCSSATQKEPTVAETAEWYSNTDERPVGRYARPGDLEGPPRPPRAACRRCGLLCAWAGHPNGCPRTPGHSMIVNLAIRPCYCGASMVLAPEWLGPCCADTPPVQLPDACIFCGSDLFGVCDPEDEPTHATTGPSTGGWAHPRCVKVGRKSNDRDR